MSNALQESCFESKITSRLRLINEMFNADFARCENVIFLSSLNPSNERRGKCHYSQKFFTFLGLFFLAKQ